MKPGDPQKLVEYHWPDLPLTSIYVRDLTEHRTEPLGEDLILLGGSKTSAAPGDERAGGEITPRYEQTFVSMR